MSLGKRIKRIRETVGINQNELAAALKRDKDISQATVSSWENDTRKPDYEILVDIAKIGRVTLDWLLTGEESSFKPPITPYEELKGTTLKILPAYRIPVLSKVTAGDSGSIYTEDNIVRFESVPYKPTETQFYLEVEGESMVRVTGRGINPGDHVKLDTTEVTAYDGDVVVVATVDGRQLIKQYVNFDKDSIELRSFNPEFPSIFVRKVDIVRFYPVLDAIPRSWKP